MLIDDVKSGMISNTKFAGQQDICFVRTSNIVCSKGHTLNVMFGIPALEISLLFRDLPL